MNNEQTLLSDAFRNVPCLQHILDFAFKERLPALVRDLFTFSSKVIKIFILV
jgi:hypothetical protein